MNASMLLYLSNLVCQEMISCNNGRTVNCYSFSPISDVVNLKFFGILFHGVRHISCSIFNDFTSIVYMYNGKIVFSLAV